MSTYWAPCFLESSSELTSSHPLSKYLSHTSSGMADLLCIQLQRLRPSWWLSCLHMVVRKWGERQEVGARNGGRQAISPNSSGPQSMKGCYPYRRIVLPHCFSRSTPQIQAMFLSKFLGILNPIILTRVNITPRKFICKCLMQALCGQSR